MAIPSTTPSSYGYWSLYEDEPNEEDLPSLPPCPRESVNGCAPKSIEERMKKNYEYACQQQQKEPQTSLIMLRGFIPPAINLGKIIYQATEMRIPLKQTLRRLVYRMIRQGAVDDMTVLIVKREAFGTRRAV